jgi:hypothetical protein
MRVIKRSFGGLENTGSYVATQSLSDDAATPPPPRSLRDIANGPTVSTGAAIALTYHGYKRTGSIVWALIYGLAGKVFPIEAVPIALAQGFGTRKQCP